MNKVLYISIFHKTKETLLSDGVMKKINLHLECLRRLGNSVDYFYTDGESIFFNNNDKDILVGKKEGIGFVYFNKLIVLAKKMIKQLDLNYDYIYIRHEAFSLRGYNALKYLSKRSNCIYLEYPTFFIPPKSFKNFVKYFFEKHLHKYVYKAVVDSLDKEAYQMPTLRIINGTDLTKINPRVPTNTQTINVMLVAFIQDYHGVDKIINATKEYYKKGGTRDVLFHIVGDGPMLLKYREDCEKYQLSNHIKFYGTLSGDPLDEVFNKCEMGISSLANKELGVTCSSTLKSKEYLAKGLPIISDTLLDVFVDTPKYFFYILKENFNLDELISFYDDVYQTRDKQTIINDIRAFAEETCDMFKVFKGVDDDYLNYVRNQK